MFPRLGNSVKYKLSQVARTSIDFCATRRNSTEMDATSHRPHTAAGYNLAPASPNHSMHCANQNNHNPKIVTRTSSDFCATRRNSTEMDATSHRPHTAAGYNFTAHLGTICLLRRQITRCTLQTRTTTNFIQLQGHRVISASNAEIVPRWMLYHTSITAHLGTICLLRRQITRCTLQTRTTATLKQLLGHRVISAQRAEIVPRWMLHQTTFTFPTRTTTTLKQLPGHRVISAQRAEIVPRWILN
jgi:hypothetical protein